MAGLENEDNANTGLTRAWRVRASAAKPYFGAPNHPLPMAADVRTPPPGPRAFLIGLAGFVAFETLAYFLLSWLVSGLGESNQFQPENTIVRNWVKTTAFLLGHLALVVTALLVLSNRLPRHYRGQIMRWFLLSLLVMFLLLWPLFE